MWQPYLPYLKKLQNHHADSLILLPLNKFLSSQTNEMDLTKDNRWLIVQYVIF